MKIPQIGFGTWRIKDHNEGVESVKVALETGYRLIDTAQIYGNEAAVGEGIKASGVPREDIYLTTKIWTGNFSPELVAPSFAESLEKLRTDYVDLLLLHWPRPGRHEAWIELEKLHQAGTVKHIGVSNYTIRHLDELLASCKVKPAVNQVELHVYLQQPELIQYCKNHDIAVEAYSPLVHGARMDHPVLKDVAAKHDKTPAQIMLRWCIDAGTIPLPKSVTPDRIRSNFDVLDFQLDDEDMVKIKQLNTHERINDDPNTMA
ncbi:MAG: glyoxal reductase [Candidatus Saccharibacteria bacterium]|jgi:diketogulonate reductase-like aldo/keto reductase|nr:glyoxal reductase [Candidatus Saccharibacteria bacterium]